MVEIEGNGDGWLYKRYKDGTIEFRDELEPGQGFERFLTPELKEQIRKKESQTYLTEDL